MWLGKPKPSGLGVGTNKVYACGLNIDYPAPDDRLVPEDRWDPRIAIPRILPLVQDKAYSRAFENTNPRYSVFVVLWSAVRVVLSLRFHL